MLNADLDFWCNFLYLFNGCKHSKLARFEIGCNWLTENIQICNVVLKKNFALKNSFTIKLNY